MTNLADKYNKLFYEEIPPKVASREIKYTEYRRRGFEETGRVLADVLAGKNTGKAIIFVADDWVRNTLNGSVIHLCDYR